MYPLIIVLLIIVAILTCGIVLIQESKGGGLASGFSSSNQVLGVRKTTDFLEKATWTLAAAMVLLCILSAAFAGGKSDESSLVAPSAIPTAPATQANPLTPGAEAAPAEDASPSTEAAPVKEAAPAETPAPAPAEETTEPAAAE